MTADVFIEASRSVWFSDACDGSKSGHRVVRMFSELPFLGCLNCRRRNRKTRLAGEQLYHYMLDTTGATSADAFAASGWLPHRSRRFARPTGLVGAGTGIPETSDPALGGTGAAI